MSEKKHQLLLGAHMSISGGFDKAIIRGESIGCTCIQIFTKSNQQWYAKPIVQEEITSFKTALKNSTIQSVVVHSSYLINIGSSDKALHKKSMEALSIELERCQALDIPYLVLHPGAAGKASVDECCAIISDSLDIILEKHPGKTMILLENTAGQGSVVGSTFEQLAMIYHKIHHKKRIGFCFDTCHAFSAGYDFRTPETYQHMWHQFDCLLGLEHLKAIHLNDSKKGCGSHIDRHEHIGKGMLGLPAFSLLCNDKQFFDIPKILETPKEADMRDDIKNIATVKSLLNNTTMKKLQV